MVLSCAAEYTALPQRLAATASQYSKNTMAQLIMMTTGSATFLYFQWPYHANIMKTLEPNRIRTGKTDGEIVGIYFLSKNLSANTQTWNPVPSAVRYRLI